MWKEGNFNNMKILFIFHAFHQKTGSHSIWSDICKELGEVTLRADDSFNPIPQTPADLSDAKSFDLIWCHQNFEPAVLCARMGCKNIVFTPMFDNGLPRFNIDCLKGPNVKIICHSSGQYMQLQGMGFKNLLYVKYYPEPRKDPIVDFTTIRPYFWQRRAYPSWGNVLELLGQAPYDKLRLKWAPDPGAQAMPPGRVDCDLRKIEMTGWTSREEADRILCGSNLYFAPREMEGVGLAYLNAMALGIPVVAPDASTHNEYIRHGHTGWLYNRAESVSAIPELSPALIKTWSYNLKNDMADGYKGWLVDREMIKQFIGSFPTIGRGNIPEPGMTGEAEIDNLTVCVVVKNDLKGLYKTMASVLVQEIAYVPVVIVDGGSTDGTENNLLWRKRGAVITTSISEPDTGIYDAMNRAARIAKTDYVIFINAGDSLYRPDSLERLSEAIDRANKADFIVGSFCYVDEQGREIIRWLKRDIRDSIKEVISGDFTRWYEDGIPHHNSTAIRRQLLLDYPFDCRLTVSADTDQMFRCYAAGYRFVPANVIVNRFVSGGNSSRKRMLALKDMRLLERRISRNPKKIDGYIKGALPHEIRYNIKFGMKWADWFEMFKLFPLETVYFTLQVLKKPSIKPLQRAKTVMAVILSLDERGVRRAIDTVTEANPKATIEFVATADTVAVIRMLKPDEPVIDLSAFAKMPTRCQNPVLIVTDPPTTLPGSVGPISPDLEYHFHRRGIKHPYGFDRHSLVSYKIKHRRVIGLTKTGENVYQ